MRDYYQDGFDDGYGRSSYGDREYPRTNCDKHSYQQGLEHGRRRQRISDELDREDGYYD